MTTAGSSLKGEARGECIHIFLGRINRRSERKRFGEAARPATFADRFGLPESWRVPVTTAGIRPNLPGPHPLETCPYQLPDLRPSQRALVPTLRVGIAVVPLRGELNVIAGSSSDTILNRLPTYRLSVVLRQCDLLAGRFDRFNGIRLGSRTLVR